METYLMASSLAFNYLPAFCSKLRKSALLAEKLTCSLRNRLSSVDIQSNLPFPAFCLCQQWHPGHHFLPYHRWPQLGCPGAAGPVRAPSQPEPLLSFLPGSCCQRVLNSWLLQVSVPAQLPSFPISLTWTPSPISHFPSFPISAQVTWASPSLLCLGLEVQWWRKKFLPLLGYWFDFLWSQ